jgi:flagellar basal body-associated protein FliL
MIIIIIIIIIIVMIIITLKHSQIWVSKQLGEKVIKIPALGKSEKVNRYRKSSIMPSWQQYLQPGPGPSCDDPNTTSG